VLLFLASNGGGCGFKGIRKMVKNSAFLASGEIHYCWYDDIAALSAYLYHLELHLLYSFGKPREEVTRTLVSTLAIFQRKEDW
jgi:hypothetical protein